MTLRTEVRYDKESDHWSSIPFSVARERILKTKLSSDNIKKVMEEMTSKPGFVIETKHASYRCRK